MHNPKSEDLCTIQWFMDICGVPSLYLSVFISTPLVIKKRIALGLYVSIFPGVVTSWLYLLARGLLVDNHQGDVIGISFAIWGLMGYTVNIV